MLLFRLFIIAIPSTFLSLCGLLAMWLALGRTNIAIRLPLFLAGTAALGLLPCLAASSATDAPAITYAFAASFIAASLTKMPLPLKCLSFTIGVLALVPLQWIVPLNSLDTRWIMRVAGGTSLAAAFISVLRWFGYRMINLTDGIPNLEIEQGTGRGLDEWLRELDQAGGKSLNHAELMAVLRPYGFSFAWQKTLTTAYERALGRWVVGRAADGSDVVVQAEDADLAAWITSPKQQQFTIWQLIVATFCAALMLTFARAFDWYRPTTTDLLYGLPLTAGIALLSIAALVICLAIRRPREQMKSLVVTVVIVAAVAQYTVSFTPLGWGVFGLAVLPNLLAYATFITLALFSARGRGYRLVRVQPQLATPPPPALLTASPEQPRATSGER